MALVVAFLACLGLVGIIANFYLFRHEDRALCLHSRPELQTALERW